MSILATILGSTGIIEKGMELIDDAFESDAEKLESRANAKIDMLKAYAPFKLAQRYLALMFTTVFLFCFFLALGIVLFTDPIVTQVAGMSSSVHVKLEGLKIIMSEFYIAEIEMMIMAFYFAGGAIDSIGRAKAK